LGIDGEFGHDPNPSSCAPPDRAPRLLEPADPVNRLRQGAVHWTGQLTRGVVAITLQSTIGGFSAEFMRKLPKLEQAMTANGLDPAEFVISKDRATPATVPLLGPFFYEYTVFFGDEKFTVTEPNDMKFLEYFYDRCVAPDDAEPEPQTPRPPGLISRIFRWMAQPI
jgi:hypothetical protein